MGIEELREEIIEKTAEELNSIEGEQKKEEQRILHDAYAKKKEIEAQAKKSAKGRAESERNERIAAAKLKARKIVNSAKDEVVDSILQECWKDFVKITKQKSYSKLLRKLIEEGVSEVGKGAVVYTNSSGKKVAKKLRVKGVKIASKTIDCEGGAVISSKDGKVSVRSTLKDIFESRRDELRSAAYKEAF